MKQIDSARSALALLWEQGFFRTWKTQKEIEGRLNELGHHYSVGALRMALTRAAFITALSTGTGLQFAQRRPVIDKRIDEVENQLFEAELVKKFGSTFETEMADLLHNFGRSGTCTAFLLRKILEKLIYIMFSRNGKLDKIEDGRVPGRIIGLEAMLKVCTQEKKANGTPYLTSNTATAVQGVKFLGDASAHNPIANIDMKTILPQMPYIITAYKELLDY